MEGMATHTRTLDWENPWQATVPGVAKASTKPTLPGVGFEPTQTNVYWILSPTP